MELKSPQRRGASRVSADWPEGRDGSRPHRIGARADAAQLSSYRVYGLGAPTAVGLYLRHGLTRNGRDFDQLATALAGRGRRVICPDLPGRGQSDRLQDSSDYVLPQYCSDMTVLMAALGPAEVDWIGTSLGGLIGMVLAGLPGSPIRRIVINDIGPYLPWAGLLRLGANLNEAPTSFERSNGRKLYFRRVLAPFGQLEDAHWRHLTRTAWHGGRRELLSSRLCDPNIAHAFRNPWHYSVDLWKYWDAINVPILVIAGNNPICSPKPSSRT